MNPDDEVILSDMEDIEDYMGMMNGKGMNWEIIAYLAMIAALKMLPDTRSMGNALSMRNPLHGTVFWFIVKEFLVYSVEQYQVDIPGLSTTDGGEQELSSHETVAALATAKLAALTAICEEQEVKVPDYSLFFFQTHLTESLGEDDPLDDGHAESAGSDSDDNDDEDDDEDSAADGDKGQPKKKKAKAAANTA